MAGFFDFLTPDDPMKQQSLLAAAAAMLQGAGDPRKPFGFGQALGTGVGAYQGSMQQQQQFHQQQALRDLQMKSAQAELDDQNQGRQRKQAMYDAAAASNTTPEQQTMAGGGGPTLANAAKIPTSKGGFDLEGFANRMMSIDPLQGIQLMQSLKKAGPKFDSGITWVNRPDGTSIGIRTADDGSYKVVDGVAPRDKMELANLGNRDVAYNPYGLKDGQSFTRGLSPDGAASNALGWANYGLSKERVGIERQEAANRATQTKAPTEFQGKSAAYGLRATEADKILTALDGKYSPSTINSKAALSNVWGVGGLLGAGANSLMNPADQQAEQAQRDFINAVLRQESGAAIGQAEFENAAKQYFRQPGDSPAVIAQKARDRQLAIQGLQANAGKAALTAPAAPAAPAGGIKFLGFE